MAFIFAIDPVVQPAISWLEGNGEYIATFSIGHDDETGDVVTGMVILCPLPGYANGERFELVFRVVVSSADQSDIRDCHDGLATKALLKTPLERFMVLGAVCLAAGELIDGLRPSAVEMVTFTANLPPRAIEKFNLIASLFAARGYDISRPDPYHGRYIWMMRLP